MLKTAVKISGLFFTCLCLTACGKSGPETFRAVCKPLADIPEYVSIPAGSFQMGSNEAYREERPVRTETVGAFKMLSHEVTNREYQAFVEATGYVTVAERAPDPALHPDIPKDQLVAGSAIFLSPLESRSPGWWEFRKGANWKYPEGPDGGIFDPDKPVIHIAYPDALAYAKWRGGDLPLESEWEYAARGGLDGQTYAWGETPVNEGPPRANTWQGAFPIQDIATDGNKGLARPACYPPNGYGLYDMTGNVWEWVKEADGARNAGTIKGGSFLCAPNYCARYRPAAKQPQELDFSTNHIGFRIVIREE